MADDLRAPPGGPSTVEELREALRRERERRAAAEAEVAELRAGGIL